MLHRTLAILGLLSLVAIPASGATNPFIGTWQTTTVASGIRLTVQLVLNPQGGFSELDQGISPTAGRMMTQETGTYSLFAPNMLRLNVVNWQPKVQCVAPSGCVPVRKPPGTTYRYRFTSATTFTAQDVTFGNGPTLIYHRIR
jgi:hypothetical protein